MSNGINSSLVQCAALVFSGRGGNITFVLGFLVWPDTVTRYSAPAAAPLWQCGKVQSVANHGTRDQCQSATPQRGNHSADKYHQAYVWVCYLFQRLTPYFQWQWQRMDTQVLLYLFMISSPFPLVDIFGMQTSWATHVINIMALNNCDQNSCGVGLHNRQHFLYLMHPVMTTKILKISRVLKFI